MRFLVLLTLFCRNVGADYWRPLHTFLLKLSHARSPIYNSTTKIFRFKMWPRRVVLKSLQFHKLWIWYDVRANQQFALTLASSTLTKLTLIRLGQAQVKSDLKCAVIDWYNKTADGKGRAAENVLAWPAQRDRIYWRAAMVDCIEYQGLNNEKKAKFSLTFCQT